MAFERRIMTRYDASTAGFDRGTRRVSDQLARLERTTDSRLGAIDRRFARAGRAALSLGVSLAGITAGLGVAAVRDYAEAWRFAERQLTAAGEAIEGNRERLARLAIRTRSDFNTTSSAVARFARVTGDGLDSSIRRVETLQKLLTVGGATGSEARSATLQLTQGLRSGQLGGEELRAIREAAPIEFLDALARRAGGTRADLKELGAEAKLTSEVIKGALDDLAQEADRKFAQLALSGREAGEILGTGFSVFFGRIDEQLGATEGLNEFLASTGDFLANDAEAASNFADALGFAAQASLALAGAKGLGAVNLALRRGAAERQAAVASTASLVAAERQALAVAEQRTVQLGARFAAAQAELRLAQQQRATLAQQAASSTQLALTDQQLLAVKNNLAAATIREERATAALLRAKSALVASNSALFAASGRAAVATDAMAAAQARLSLATRALTGAMATLRGAFAFIGGLPGLILLAVSAAVLFTGALKDQNDRLDDLEGNLRDVENGLDRVRRADEDLARDTEALERANGDLTAAIAAQSDAAIDVARIEIDAINRRIAANQALKAEYQSLIGAQLQLTQGQLQIEQEAFAREFGGRTQGIFEFETPTREERSRRAAERIAEIENEIADAQSRGLRLSDEQVEFLERRVRLRELELDAASKAQALERLVNPPPPVEGGGSGVAAPSVEENAQALADFIRNENERNALSREQLTLEEEIARVIKDAGEEGLELSRAQAEVIAQNRIAAEEARREASRSDGGGGRRTLSEEDTDKALELLEARERDIDQLRLRLRLVGLNEEAAARLVFQEEALNQAREEGLDLNARLAGSERTLAEAISDQADEFARLNKELQRQEALQTLGDELGQLVATADSFADALENVALKLFEIGAQDFFNALLGNAGGGPFSGFFEGIFDSFDTGGFTGGRRGQPRGVVHGEEFVVRAGPARKFLPMLEAINSGRLPGFANGGFVNATTPITVPQLPAGGGSSSISVNVEGSTVVLQGSNATPQEIQRLLDRRDRDLIRKIAEANERDPNFLHT